MSTIGTDCHITLTHPDVNGGQPYGFLLDPHARITPQGWQLTKEVSSDPLAAPSTGGVVISCYLPIILANDLVNPNGSRHTDSYTAMYNMLQQYLSKLDSITITTPIGAILGLGALGKTADERHFAEHSICKIQLNNAGIYFPAIDPAILALSVWDGTLTWSTSYWRRQ